MLTPGEFVVKKAAVDKYGMNMLSALNEGYLHKGGPVGHKHKYGASSTPTPSGKTYVGGDGLNRDGNDAGFDALFNKKNWEKTANFFGLPSIGKTLQDLMKYGGPSPVGMLGMTAARLTGQDMKSTLGDNAIAASNVIPIPIAKLAKPVVNAAAKIIPQGVKKFVEKDLGIDMFTKLSAKLNNPGAISVANAAPEVPVVADPVTPTIKTPTAKQGTDVSKLTPEERSFHMAGIDQDAIMAIKGADPSSMSVPDAGSSFNPGQANAGLNYLKTGGSDYKPYTAQIWELVQSQREALLRQKYPNMDFSDVKSFNEAYAQEFYGIGNEESIALFKGVHALDSPQTAWREGDGNLGTYFSTNPYIAALYAAMLGNSKVGQELPMFMTSSMIKDLKNFLGEGAVRNGNAQGSMEFPQVLSGSQMAQTYPTPYSLPGYVYPEMFGQAPTSLKQLQDQWPFKFDQPSSITSPTPTVTSATKSPIFTPEIIEGGSSNYKGFTIGEDSTKFTFKGLDKGKGTYESVLDSDMADLDNIADSLFIIPTTPQGLIEAALKLNPNDKSLLSLLNNFKAKQYGPAETELLDFMVASSYIDKTNKVAPFIDTEGLALVISHLSGDKNATSLLNNKKTILNEILAKDKSGASPTPSLTPSMSIPELNQVPVIHSTSHKLNYDKDGNIIIHPSGYHRVGEGQLPRGEGTKEAYDVSVARPTVHTTLYGSVANLITDAWKASNTKIVSGLGGMIDANGNPYGLNPTDTFWSKSPGEALVFPKGTTSVIHPFEDEMAYAKELISRGIIKEGDKVPVIASDPNSNNILHLTKEKYTDDELQQIADLVQKESGERLTIQDGQLLTKLQMLNKPPTFQEMATPTEYLDRMAIQLAKQKLNIEGGPVHINGPTLSGSGATSFVQEIQKDLGIPNLVHAGSTPALRERPSFFDTPDLERADSGYSYSDPLTIDSLRFNALSGNYETPKVTKDKMVYDNDGFKSSAGPLTIADLEPYLNPTDFAADTIPLAPPKISNMTIPPIGPLTNLFNNEDTPVPPKIIKSTISAGKLKQLKKFMDPDLLMATGGLVPGLGNKDTISSMLTPGEFVIKKSAVEAYGANNLAKINDGTSTDSSVYNYSLSVNVNGNNLNADDIASTVMQKIKYIDGQRIRGQR
jgi:hypothetical protein